MPAFAKPRRCVQVGRNAMRNLQFPYKVWGSALFAAPLIYFAIAMVLAREFFPSVGVMLIVFFAIIGGVISLPTLFVYLYACREFSESGMNRFWVRILSALVASLGLLFTVYLISGQDAFSFEDDRPALLILSYIISIFLFSFLYRPSLSADNDPI